MILLLINIKIVKFIMQIMYNNIDKLVSVLVLDIKIDGCNIQMVDESEDRMFEISNLLLNI